MCSEFAMSMYSSHIVPAAFHSHWTRLRSLLVLGELTIPRVEAVVVVAIEDNFRVLFREHLGSLSDLPWVEGRERPATELPYRTQPVEGVLHFDSDVRPFRYLTGEFGGGSGMMPE